jgi:ABC-type antimicrobial peptide transport system permease subunit
MCRADTQHRFNLPVAHGDRIAHLDGVTGVSHETYSNATYQDSPQEILILATPPESWAVINAVDVNIPPGAVEALKGNRTGDPKQAAARADAIDALFANSSDETRTQSKREMAQSQFQAIGDVDFIVRSISAAVLFSLLFSISALLMQGVRERTTELAVLKAVGFESGRIPMDGRLELPRTVVLLGLGLALILSLATALLPARRGLKLRIATALADT